MSANEVEFIGLEYAAKLTNKMGGNSDEDGSLIQKHWIGKLIFYFLLSLKKYLTFIYKYFVSILILHLLSYQILENKFNGHSNEDHH